MAISKLIALCADGGCGKTSVLLRVAYLMNADKSYRLVSSSIPIPTTLPPPNKDGVFTFIRGNKKIRVVTAGDDPKYIKESLDQAEKDNIDWYIGASRAKHTRTDVYEIFAMKHNIKPLYMFCPWIDKVGRTSTQKIQDVAEQIKEIVESPLALW